MVAGGRVYLTGNSGGTDYLYCLDPASGGEIWKKSYSCPEYGRRSTGDKGEYKGPSSTPEYDPATGYLYTLSIDGHLDCWDTNSSGQRKWGFNLYGTYGVAQRPNVGGGLRDYGYTSSPLVHGSWVIVEVGDNEGNLMAFDKLTGARQWASQNADPAGHTGGPVPITVQGVPCVAVLTLHRLLVARLDGGREGETVGTYGWETDYANNITTPTVSGNKVVLTSNYNISKTVMLTVTLSGISADWQKSGKWAKVCSPVIYKDRVYLGGGTLKCFDNTGNIKWEGGSFGDDTSLVFTSDERLMVFGGGKLALVDSAELSSSYNQRAIKSTGLGRAWPHVVLANGRAYCKDRYGNLHCYDLSSGTSTVAVTVATSPSGRAVTVDGANHTAPKTFDWTPGSQHTLSVASPQGTSGTRHVFASWSGGGAQSHIYTVPGAAATVTARFSTQYQLTTAVNPSGSGTVSPSSGSWHDSGAVVSVSATANSGHVFDGWSGSHQGSAS